MVDDIHLITHIPHLEDLLPLFKVDWLHLVNELTHDMVRQVPEEVNMLQGFS
jgi:hypothetical protein